MTHVKAVSNIEVSTHDAADGDDQTIAVVSNPDFGVVTASKFKTTSDIALKENVIGIDRALDKVLGLKGVSFNWKDTSSKQIGMIANEVEKVIPEAVDTDDDGYKSIDYGGIISYLIESIKTLKVEINDLRGKR